MVLSLCILSGCLKKDHPRVPKVIIGLASCPEDEANADIRESIDQIAKVLPGKIDSAYVKEGEPGCGYKFISGAYLKLLEGAYTDVDLMEEANGFFAIDSAHAR